MTQATQPARRSWSGLSREDTPLPIAPRGCALAKLTAEQVVAMRARYDQGGITQRALAREYGIQQSQVSEIVRRTSWKGVP